MTTKRGLLVSVLIFITLLVVAFFLAINVPLDKDNKVLPGDTPINNKDASTDMSPSDLPEQEIVSYPEAGSAEEILEMSITTEESLDANLEDEIILEDFSDDLAGMEGDADFLLSE
jgi:hypothetical protein